MSEALFNEIVKDVAATQKKKSNLRERDEWAAAEILKACFQQQRDVICDPFRQKALITPRRSGKTFTVGSYVFHTALTKPGSVCAIVTLTLKSAKRLYWHDIVLNFSDTYGLNLRRRGGIHHTNLEVNLENGSRIFLVGAETRAEIEKLRGGAYDLVCIDECKSFHPAVFSELVNEVVLPAISDKLGSLLITGTPGNILSGPFYEATYENYLSADGYPISKTFGKPEGYWKDNPDLEPVWSRHTWTVKENISERGQNAWRDAMSIKKRNRWKSDNPIWQREWLGKWVATSDAMVYAYANLIEMDGGAYDARCTWKPKFDRDHNRWGLPSDKDWEYVLGLDLGFEDDLAIVVFAYNKFDGNLYHVYDFKQPHMTMSKVGQKLLELVDMFDDRIVAMVADTGAGGKMVIESLNEIEGLYLVPAEKNQKYDHIEWFNSDLYDGKIKILPDSELAHEMLMLQWDLGGSTKRDIARIGKLKEDRACPNHACDAALYTWRFALHHYSRERPWEPTRGTDSWFDEWDRKEAEAAVRDRDSKNKRNSEWTDSKMEERLWTDLMFDG